MSTTVTYKGNTLTTVNNNTKTLKTAGKYMEGDVLLTDITSASPTIQSLDIVPSEAPQTFNASNIDGYKPITVAGIPLDYVGSGIDQRFSSDLTVSGATVTVPAGYYENQASKSVSTMTLPTSTSSSATSGYTNKATIGRSTSTRYINIPPGYNSTGAYYTISATPNGSATGPSSLSGSSATVTTGTNTLTLTKTEVTTTPTVNAGYISAATASTATVTLTANVTTKVAATITPSTTNQTIASGTYLTGTQTIAGDSDLIAANIKTGVSIFNTNGTFTSDATASAADILSGETAYVNGVKVTGSLNIHTVYTGSSAPASNLGSNGDIYLQE